MIDMENKLVICNLILFVLLIVGLFYSINAIGNIEKYMDENCEDRLEEEREHFEQEKNKNSNDLDIINIGEENGTKI